MALASCLRGVKRERTAFGPGRKSTRKPLFLTLVLSAVLLTELEGEKPLWRAPQIETSERLMDARIAQDLKFKIWEVIQDA
jgi:hypothetical protein